MQTPPFSPKLSALVIERPLAKRSLLVELLKELAFSVVIETHSVDTALDCMGMAAFDAIFVEVNSRRDGNFLFIRRVRLNRTLNPRVPIIVVSSNLHRDVIERTRDVGANGFLAKPF